MEAEKIIVTRIPELQNSSCSTFQHKLDKRMVPPARSHFHQSKNYLTMSCVQTIVEVLPEEITEEIEDLLEYAPKEKQLDVL